MDFVETFKSEIFRPVVTLVVPGAVSIGPYIIVAGYHIHRVREFWDEHPSAFVAIVVIFGIAAGLVLENLGAEIENLWDWILAKKDNQHNATWEDYLKLELKDEIIGQRYLRIVLTWMKFELAMFPALLSLWFGLMWVTCIYHTWSTWGFTKLSIFILGLAGYLLYSSYDSAKNLSGKRKLIIEAVRARPVKALTP
jgi:hypothetical protein